VSDDFKYECRRRSNRRRPPIEPTIAKSEAPPGAGSGGDANGGNSHHLDAIYALDAPGFQFLAAGQGGADTVISLVSAGGFPNMPTGSVEVHANKEVRISAGPPGDPPAQYSTGAGVTLEVGENENILLLRGKGFPDSISLFRGRILIRSANIDLEATQGISLAVGNGLSTITMSQTGISIQGLVTKIN
jgi:hypothetical protein